MRAHRIFVCAQCDMRRDANVEDKKMYPDACCHIGSQVREGVRGVGPDARATWSGALLLALQGQVQRQQAGQYDHPGAAPFSILSFVSFFLSCSARMPVAD